MAEEEAQRTEPATPRRREEARRKGDVAQSREIQSVVVLGAALLALGSFLGVGLLSRMALLARSSWSGAFGAPDSMLDFHAALLHHTGTAALGLVPLMLLMAGAGALAQVVQTGPLFSLEALQFRGQRLSPVQGMKRLLGPDRLFDLGKSLFKVAVVLGIGWTVVESELPAIAGLARMGVADGLALTGDLSRRLATAVLVALAGMAALDLLYQRWRYERKLRMSKREVRDELKQREGDPILRGRLRALQRELSRSRMIAAVANADVVVTNPTHYAVALRYERSTMSAPQVVAKGRNQVALRIRRVAREHGIPIVENPPLARILHRTSSVGREVPENLFQAVAEVLAYVYRLDRRRAAAWGGSS